jgi:peptidoglycan/LPS O-acetylase OafA/YrhL
VARGEGGEAEPTLAPLASLSGLRAVAAAVVLLSHVGGRFPGEPFGALAAVSRAADAAVTVFFVLSGAMVTMTWRRRDTAPAFWRRRAARIVPLYLGVGVASLAWVVVQGPRPDGLEVVAFFTFTQAWSGAWATINNPAWSLSCEALFYLVHPALRRGLGVLAHPLASAGALVALLGLHWSLRDLAFHLPPVRLVDFVVGCLVGLAVRRGRGRPVPPAVALLLLAAAYAGVNDPDVAGPHPVVRTAFLAVAALAVGALARADLAGAATGLRWLAPLGVRSYALYLSHYLVIRVAVAALDHVGLFAERGAVAGTATALAVVLACTAVAEGLHRAVERPAERRFRGAPARPALA